MSPPKVRRAGLVAEADPSEQNIPGGDRNRTSVSRLRSELPWSPCAVYVPPPWRKKYVCPTTCTTCGAGTAHRLDGPDIDGTERTGCCGHRYRLRVRRIYTARVLGNVA